MPTLPLGDVQVNYPNLPPNNTNSAVAITAFRREMNEIGVYEFSQDDFVGKFATDEVDGKDVSYLRMHGQNNPRREETLGDRSFRPSATRHSRRVGRYFGYAEDFVIREDEQVAIQVRLAKDIARRIAGMRARLPIQVVLNALDTLPVTDTATNAQDGLLAVVPSTIGWDAINKRRITAATGAPTKWNKQKQAVIQTLLTQGNVPQGDILTLASPLTVDGFSEDEQSINMDYQVQFAKGMQYGGGAYMGLPGFYGMNWYLLPQLPDQDYIGTHGKGGFKPSTMTVNSVAYNLFDEYAFDRNCIILLTSSENPMFRVDIHHDWWNKQMAFRFTAYIGALVLNPKGVLRISNAYNAATPS